MNATNNNSNTPILQTSRCV